MSTKVVIIKDHEHPLASQNTPLYCATITCGGQLAPEGYLHSVGQPKEGAQPERTVVWLLKDQEIVFKPFAGEVISTQNLIERWNNHPWLAANPDHPITFMKYLLENLNNTRDFLKKDKPLLQVKKGCRTAFIPHDASPEEKERLLKLLNK